MMRALSTFVFRLVGGRLQILLVACLALVAAFTVIIGTTATARLINDYLSRSEDESVARDMGLAQSFYQIKLQEIASASTQLATDPLMAAHFQAALDENPVALVEVQDAVDRVLDAIPCECMNIMLVMDTDGEFVLARARSTGESDFHTISQGNWQGLPIVSSSYESRAGFAATEIIPVDYLKQVGLAEQAHITIIPTEQSAPMLFNPEEGRSGLGLVGVYPIIDERGNLLGSVLAAHLFNNDFNLVDQIKTVAGIDTVTVFFGDLRVSTNVLNEDGERAVGTRVSQDVFDTVLVQGEPYKGRAFVVNEWYTTRYEPLRDHVGEIVGSLYVGTRVAVFQSLMRTFNRQVALIAAVGIILAGIIAIPITRFITRPIEELVDANRRLAQGNMTVRISDFGPGDMGELGRSFNAMVETLHRTQQELLHKEKLASMGQLSAGVAHEINNPLASILLYADMLYKEADEGDPRRDDLRMIIHETTRCKNIVADLLNFARQQNVMAQDTDLHALLEHTLEALQLLPAYEQIAVQRDFDDQVTNIQGDPAQLQQVFTNLLNNAAEAMPLGGTIQLVTRQAPGGLVEIRITDTGEGISAENMGKLFTPFFTTKGPGKGTGLGLSIVYGIIKMHRGQITVKSSPGEGTTFTVTLPVTHPGNKLVLQGELIG